MVSTPPARSAAKNGPATSPSSSSAADCRLRSASPTAPDLLALSAVPPPGRDGLDDPMVDPETLHEWGARTTADARVHHFPGGHHYLRSQVADVVNRLTGDPLAAYRSPAPDPAPPRSAPPNR